MNKIPSEINIDDIVRLVLKDLARQNVGDASAQAVPFDNNVSKNGRSFDKIEACCSGEVLAALCRCRNEKKESSVNYKRSENRTDNNRNDDAGQNVDQIVGNNGSKNNDSNDQNILTVQDKLISVELIETRDDHKRKNWRVPRRAVITPLARDEFRKRGITLLCDEIISMDSPDKTIIKNGSNVKTGLINSAVLQNDLSGSDRPIVLAFHDLVINPFLKGMTERLSLRNRLTVFQKSCIMETTSALALELQNSEKAALLLTNHPSLALMLANRRKEIRAVLGRSVEELKTELKLTGPNLLILDPAKCGAWQLQQMIDWFLEKGPFVPPAFIQKALEQNI